MHIYVYNALHVLCTTDSASKTGFGTYYCDKSNGLFTDDGGLFQLNNGFSTQTGINWTSGDQGVCYMIAEMFYKARGTDATY